MTRAILFVLCLTLAACAGNDGDGLYDEKADALAPCGERPVSECAGDDGRCEVVELACDDPCETGDRTSVV